MIAVTIFQRFLKVQMSNFVLSIVGGAATGLVSGVMEIQAYSIDSRDPVGSALLGGTVWLLASFTSGLLDGYYASSLTYASVWCLSHVAARKVGVLSGVSYGNTTAAQFAFVTLTLGGVLQFIPFGLGVLLSMSKLK